MTQPYIGTKQIMAWPAENPNPQTSDQQGQPGYMVRYPDGYTSWSPKDVFEAAYLPMGEDSDGTSITQEMVDDFIVDWKDDRIGPNYSTTVVTATLRNGLTLVASSGAVDPENYDHEVGVNACLDLIRGQVWRMLGFLLASARNGINR